MTTNGVPENTTNVKFLCYRYAVVPNGQMGIWQDVEFSKRHVMNELMAHCSEKGPFSSSYMGSENVLVYIRAIGSTAHLCKFCKKQKVRRHEIEMLGESFDVVQHEYDSYPFIYVIVDLDAQVALVQRKSSVFKNPGGAKAALAALVKEFLADDNYYFSLEEITSNASFWDAVKAADLVYDLELKLESPNFLGAGYTTTGFLKRVQEVTNNDRLSIRLSNESGELELSRQEYEDAIDYVADGGGSWSLTTASGDSRRVTHKSDEFVRVIDLRISDQRPLDDGDVIVEIRRVGARKEVADVTDTVGT